MKKLIRNGTIIAMDKNLPQILRGDVAIEGRTIVAVGAIPADFKAERVINAGGSIVLPGLVNAHCHLGMVLLRNYADDVNLFDWLNEKIWPVEARMTPSHMYNASLVGAAELIRSGVTSFADMYFFQEETCRAIEQAGIRARIGAVFFGDEKAAGEKLPFLQNLYDEWNGRDERIYIDAAPHSMYTLSAEALRMSVDFAQKNNTRIHIHVAESQQETDESYKKHGVSPVEYLERIGIFNQAVYAAHCVYLNEDDLDILTQHGVYPVHNPASNLKFGNGFAPIPAMLQRGIRPALGTDGASSNNNLNMFEEIHLAALIHKAVTQNPQAVSASQALQMATIYGAEALGMDNVCGSLTPGKEADIILVDTEKTHLQPLHNPVAALAYAAQASDVHFVMCAGEILMEEGEILTMDEKEILSQVKKDATTLTNGSLS